jgi:hypothetical protein
VVDEETAEVLAGLITPRHEQDETLVDEAQEDTRPDLERQHLPWWKRPNPWWYLSNLSDLAIFY